MLESATLGSSHRISFGMSSLMELDTVESLILTCRDCGLDFIELNANFPHYVRETLHRRNTLSLLEQEGIDYSVHLPETLDFGVFQSEFRDAAVSMIAGFCDLVKPGTRFVYHMNSGIPVRLPDEQVFLYKRYEHEYLDALEETISVVSAILDGEGCSLCIENLGNFSLPHIFKGVELMLSLPSVGLLWDIGHDTSSGLSDTPFFLNHLDDVKELHLHDSDGKNDHLPLGSGKADIENALSFADERALPVVVEVKTVEALKQSVAYLGRR
ncbi:MAG: TIM barrel protein [Sphaerochaetaceae bacterium]